VSSTEREDRNKRKKLKNSPKQRVGNAERELSKSERKEVGKTTTTMNRAVQIGGASRKSDVKKTEEPNEQKREGCNMYGEKARTRKRNKSRVIMLCRK